MCVWFRWTDPLTVVRYNEIFSRCCLVAGFYLSNQCSLWLWIITLQYSFLNHKLINVSCVVHRVCLSLQTSNLNMLIQTSGLQSCQVCVVIMDTETSWHLFVLLNFNLSEFATCPVFRLLTYSVWMFQSCTVTLKDQSLLSTGSALRWNSEHMVCIQSNLNELIVNNVLHLRRSRCVC